MVDPDFSQTLTAPKASSSAPPKRRKAADRWVLVRQGSLPYASALLHTSLMETLAFLTPASPLQVGARTVVGSLPPEPSYGPPARHDHQRGVG